MMISGVMICQNEEELIKQALEQLYWVHEIIIIDGGSMDRTVDIIKHFRERNPIPAVRMFRNNFNGHFGDQKNFGIALAQYPWTFVLDADETIETGLIKEIKDVANSKKYDAIAIPRKNFLNGEMTEHYPDYQYRCFRSFCRYIYPVHEELVGCRRMYVAKNHIIHSKTPQRFNYQQRNYQDIIGRMPYKFRMTYEEW